MSRSDRSETEPRSDPPRVALLVLGSNISPEDNLRRAVAELDRLLGVEAVSGVYETDPVGAPGTPRFLNAAVRVRTALTPRALKFDVLRPLEARLGRVRGADPNAPRTIDIDVAAVEGPAVVDAEAGIELPDPDITRWAHVALPLCDVAPDFILVSTRRTVREVARGFAGASGIRRRDDLELDPGRPTPNAVRANETDPR